MRPRSGGVALRRRGGLAIAEAVVAVAAIAGSLGLIVRSIDLGSTINARLPFESPRFGGGALFLVVGVPMIWAAIGAWRGSRLANVWAMSAGALLMGWIAVEFGVIQAFSWLQPTLFACGAAIAIAGYRGWHLTWGSRDEEIEADMPGDEIAVPSRFTATRALTIDAPPMAVWPWLTQVGRGRAGFYSYDVLDNGGRRSATAVLPEFQRVAAGDLAAPMSNPPSSSTSFVVASVDEGKSLVWAKGDAVWTWQLAPEGAGTRLVVRLRRGAMPGHPVRSVMGAALLEIGDFPMMQMMLRGIRDRAESLARAGAATPGSTIGSGAGTRVSV